MLSYHGIFSKYKSNNMQNHSTKISEQRVIFDITDFYVDLAVDDQVLLIRIGVGIFLLFKCLRNFFDSKKTKSFALLVYFYLHVYIMILS